MTIYEALKGAGCETDSHESDLYVRSTPDSRRIVAEWPKLKGSVPPKFFTGTDGQQWIEIPFAFDPFWTARVQGGAS